MSVYENIKNSYNSFSKAEKRVAKYCLDNYLDICNLPIAKLSELSKSGEATVFRFCQKIGFESYHDFKLQLSYETSETKALKKESYANDILESIHTSIEYTINNLDLDMLEEVSKLILKANKILCIGVGNSGIPAEACAMRFLRNGLNGIYLKDNHFQLIYLNEMKKNDFAILFSNSGETSDVLYCAKILKENNIKFLCITSSIVSSLAKISDYQILIKFIKGPVTSGNMITQIVQMYVADLINTGVYLQDKNKIMKSREITYDYATAKQKGDL